MPTNMRESLLMRGPVDATAAAQAAQLAEKAQQAHLTEKTSYGVISGLGVTAQGTPNMTVAIASGVAYMANGTRYAPSAVASQSVNAANATNPRIDIIYLSSAGAITYLAGTAGASPAAPATPTGGLLLAEISVAANQTTIAAANITAKKKGLLIGDWFPLTILSGWSAGTRIPEISKDAIGVVRLRGQVTGGTVPGAALAIPAGYRPKQTMVYPTTSNLAYGNAFYNPSGFILSIQIGSNTNVSLDNIEWVAEV